MQFRVLSFRVLEAIRAIFVLWFVWFRAWDSCGFVWFRACGFVWFRASNFICAFSTWISGTCMALSEARMCRGVSRSGDLIAMSFYFCAVPIVVSSSFL